MQPQTAEDRRRRQRDEARRAILDASAGLLLEAGVERFSIRKLSAACGYTAPTIYHHFGDKEGLILAVLEEHFSVLLRRLRRVPIGDDPVENLRAIALAFVQFGTKNPALYRLLMNSSGDGDERKVESAEAIRTIVQAPIDALMAAGRVRPSDLVATRQAVWCLVHGLTSFQVTRPDLPWSRELNAISVDAMLRGLVSDATALPKVKEATP